MKTPMVAMTCLLIACGGSKPASTTPGASAGEAPTASQGAAAPSAATVSDAAPPKAERPRAATSAEATTLIDEAVNQRLPQIAACVTEARERLKDAHAPLATEIGIDQEGALIGVKTPKGSKVDLKFNDCVRDALKGAPFPRSTSGVITVKKSFSDGVIYK
jgi:hypothetical protein